MSPSDRLAAARSVRLYFQRPELPGFLVSETAEGPVVPVFTSWERLGLFAGPCDWASTTAEDLAGLLPEGVRALVDPLGPETFLLDTDALLPQEPEEAQESEEPAADGPAADAEGDAK